MKQFKNVATINAPRSKHNLSYSVKTSCNVSELVPCYIQEIYPGDTFKCKSSFVSRLSSAYIRPVMDNLFVDFYYFFVPSRLCFNKWEEIFGENRQSAWAQAEPVSAPVTQHTMTNYSKTVADYLGLPIGQIPSGVNILPFRAFAKIYDDWFRDENLQDPMFIDNGEWTITEVINQGEWSPNNYMGKLPKVSKLHDVFTSALPNTQKADSPVMVPLGEYAPIIASETMHQLGGTLKVGGSGLSSTSAGVLGYASGTVASNREVKMFETAPSGTPRSITSTNAVADLTDAGILSVPDLRFAFQVQRILERSARTGSRYVEYLLGAFGVQSPDARLQRAEYLGGHRQPLSTQQVAQTTQGDVGELGSLGAFSLSNGQCGYSKGFVEHGFVIGVMCIRQKHTYQQGIEKFWHRSDRFSYYDPALAHISEQPIYKSELYAKGFDNLNDEVFGFQEAWYDLRNRNNHITGQMRSDADNSLDIWHYGDDYASAPFLNATFIKETPEYVDRTIAVPSTSLDQFIFDIYHDQTAIRRIPAYSIPGLIDHY